MRPTPLPSAVGAQISASLLPIVPSSTVSKHNGGSVSFRPGSGTRSVAATGELASRRSRGFCSSDFRPSHVFSRSPDQTSLSLSRPSLPRIWTVHEGRANFSGLCRSCHWSYSGRPASKLLASGLAIIGGQTYRVAQVGSFVRIPQGYVDLYGVVSEVGVSAAPEVLRESKGEAESWMTVQLVGESVGSSFEREIAQYPSVHDEVHIVTDAELRKIYDLREPQYVLIGRLANSEGTLIGVDIDKIDCAVLGSTGSGKSTTVASILRSIAGAAPGFPASNFPNSRIVVLDIHGEYGRALHDTACVYRIDAGPGENELHVPYWAIDPRELIDFLMGQLEDKQLTHVLDKVVELKARSLSHQSF